MDSVLTIIFSLALFVGFMMLLMMLAFKKPQVSIFSILFGGGYLMRDPGTYFESDRIPQIRLVGRVSLFLIVFWGVLRFGYELSGHL